MENEVDNLQELPVDVVMWRVIAVLLCVYVRTFHFSHIRPPVKIENALIPNGRGYV